MEIEFAVNGRPWRIRRVIGVSLFVVFVIAMVAGYLSWRRGVVIAELSIRNVPVFCIRQIPTAPPGLNDGYSYRCEVWSGSILSNAATYRWDSYTARSASIAINDHDANNHQDDAVEFNLDGHRITCTPLHAALGWGDVAWKSGN
jgi:hypothetical protein